MKRTKNAFRNTVVSIGGYVLIFLFGVVIRRLFLDNLNFENLGYEGLFASIMLVINTLDFFNNFHRNDKSLAKFYI